MVELFCSCLPGLEPLLVRELTAFGLAARPVRGGVVCEAEWSGAYRANLESGLATHVLARVGEFFVRSLGELARKAASIPWAEWLRPDVPFEVRAAARKSRLYHTGAIAERITDAITKSLGQVVHAGAEQPSAGVVVRMFRDTCTLSIDTSGAPLHRRSWRLETGMAPVREDLARALVVASGWDRASPFVDPMSGSGTLAIEAAGLARRLAPGRLRAFAFEQLAAFDAAAWDRVRAAAEERALTRAPAPVIGCDRSAAAVEAARANAARAGVAADAEFVQGTMTEAPFLCGEPEAEVGALVVNPPFGKRLGDPRALTKLYQALGNRARSLPPGWRVAVLAADRRLALRTGLPLETAFLTDHGGLKVRALVSAASL